MSSKIPARQSHNIPSPITSSVDDSGIFDRSLLDRSVTSSVVLRSSGPTPPKIRDDGGVAEKVKVYARIRPALREDETPGALVWSEETGQLTIFRPEAPVPHSDFVYDKVLGPTSSQADVYTTAVSEVVADVLRGYNGTILAYGQTGAGKTYTLGNSAPDAIGMIPRAAAELFSAAARDPLHMYSITMSYIQIYMEMIQDLLNPTADNLPIREDANGVFVAGACEVPVASLEECLHYLELGEQNRVFAFTHLNAHSSRSHAVVMLTAVKSRKYLTSEERAQAEAPDQDGVVTQRVTVGKLYMVDLAGSERLKKSKSVGLRATEARSINLSLTTLGMCISARAQDSPHVPFRDSKLTRLLQESLGGNAKTSLILCLSDVRQHADESLQSLQFGARAACVRNKPVVNERLQMRQLTAELLAALEENHERTDGLEAALSQTKDERDMLQAALAREKAHTAKIVDALRTEAKAKEEQAARLAAQAELLSEHVQQLGQVQQQQGQLEMEMETLKREHKAREEVHRQEVAALQDQLAAARAAAEEAAAAAAAERESLQAEARSQQAHLAAMAQQQTAALATRLTQERVAARDQAAAIHLALTRLQRALGELVSGPSYGAPSSYAAPPHVPLTAPPRGTGPEGPEAGGGDEAAARRVPPPSEAGTPSLPLPAARERSSSGGGSSSGGSGGGAGGGEADGWGSAASSMRGRSEGSHGWAGSHGGGGSGAGAPPAGADTTVSRRAQWIASLAAAVASRRGASAGSSGSLAGAANPGSLAASAGGVPGESSGGGGNAVQLIKQALGMESAAAATAAAGMTDGVPPGGRESGNGRGGLTSAVTVRDSAATGSSLAPHQFDLSLTAAAAAAAAGLASTGDKRFISPPCSSPRSHGGATVDAVPVGPYGSTHLGGTAVTPGAVAAAAPVSRRGSAATTSAAVAPTPAATELDLSDIDAALAAAQQDLLIDLGGSVRAVQLVQSGGAARPNHHNHHAVLAAERGEAGLGEDASAASLGPQSLTVSSSSGGGGYGMYGEADAGSDDGAVDSYAARAAAAPAGGAVLSTPFMQTTGRNAAAAATNATSAEGGSAHPHRLGGGPHEVASGGTSRRASGAAAGVGGVRLGSGTLNHNPAFDSVDSVEVQANIGPAAASGGGDLTHAHHYPHPYNNHHGATRLRDVGSGATGGGLPRRASRSSGGGATAAALTGSAAVSGGGSVADATAAAAAAAAAAAPWLRDSPLGGLNISGGGASDIVTDLSEGSLSMLLPPPTPTQAALFGGPLQASVASGGGGSVGGGQHGGSATRGSALFAGIQVQLDSLLEMTGTLRRIKAGLEQRIEQQALELVRRQDEVARLEAQLGDSGGQLQTSRAALAAAESKLADTISELLSVRGALDETVSELGRTRTELDGRGASLADVEARLGETAAALAEARREAEAGREEGSRMAEELKTAQAELTSERATLCALVAASARSQQISTQALVARHELQRQVRAANAIKRAYKAFKVAQLRGQVAAKQAALQEAAAVQHERDAAQAARAGQALVQESVAAMKDAVGAILAAFVGRRSELEARRTLLERLEKVMPAGGGGGGPGAAAGAAAGTATRGGGIPAVRHGSSPAAAGGTAASTVAAARFRRAATSAGVSAGPSMTPLRSRMGSNPVSLSMMLAAATLPRTPAGPAATRGVGARQPSADGAATAATAPSPAASTAASKPAAAAVPSPAASPSSVVGGQPGVGAAGADSGVRTSTPREGDHLVPLPGFGSGSVSGSGGGASPALSGRSGRAQ